MRQCRSWARWRLACVGVGPWLWAVAALLLGSRCGRAGGLRTCVAYEFGGALKLLG